MPEGTDPAVQRRRLALALKQLRIDRRLTQMQVATGLEWSHSKVVRIENGDVGISTTDLKSLLSYYEVTNQNQMAPLLTMARTGRQQRFAPYADVLSRDFLRYLQYEGSAKVVRQFESNVVPGLLQTKDYALASLRIVNPAESEERINRRANAREQRQEIINRTERPELHFIIDESVLRRRVGAEISNNSLMLNQLAHIKDVGSRPGIKVQVVRFSAGAHPGMYGPFVVLEFPDVADDHLLYLENSRGDIATRDDAIEIARYLEMFLALQKIATSPDELSQVIDELIEVLRREAASE